MEKEQGSESTVSGSQSIKEEEMAEEKEAPKRVSRRQFVKGAAVGGAGVAAAGVLASCAPAATPAPTAAPDATATAVPAQVCPPFPTPWLPEKWDEEADVVVVGCGAAGSSAAIDAHDAGADVLIVERLDYVGGSMRRCGGCTFGAGTIVQKACGIEDGPDEAYEYLVALGEGFTDPALHRVLADNCGKNVDWIIEDLGGEIPFVLTDDPGKQTLTPGLNSIYVAAQLYYEELGLPYKVRGHTFTPAPGYVVHDDLGWDGWKGGLTGGTGLWKPFEDAVTARNIRTMLEKPLIELVATPDREVLGVRVLSGGEPVIESRPMFGKAGMQEEPAIVGFTGGEPLYIKAKKGVVLGTAGFTQNLRMLKDYTPLDKRFTVNHPDHDHGEGIIAAHAIGADLTNMVFGGEPGGLRISPRAQVIDVFGNPIPRLYAGGQVAGGNVASKYSGGLWTATAICFGRIAGQNAAAEESWE